MSKKVLIVEDQFIEAHNLSMALETAGYAVTGIARSADEALLMMEDVLPQLVLLDIFLEGKKTGIDLAGDLKQMNIPFIYLSANSDADTFRLAKQTSPYGFLVKPFREKDIIAMLDIADNLHQEHLALARLHEHSDKRPALKQPANEYGMIGKSKMLKEIQKLIHIASNAETPVLVLGESGTGKELVARAIHDHSSRSKKPLVIVDCAALSPTLIESELFGHEKGSFTGALDKRLGKFEQAAEGTIFLDEVGEMPIEIQSKLLRVLQEKEICPIGGKRKKVDVRIVAATNRNLEEEVAAGRFRLDLYYRLFVFPIKLPSLRDRRSDILPIAEHYIAHYAAQNKKLIQGYSEAVKEALLNYAWPGNIRELINLVERCVLLTETTRIEQVSLPAIRTNGPDALQSIKSMADNERDHILQTLARCNWRIYGRGGAADLLNINASTLRSRMSKLGIVRKFD
ncbi:sigma-54-dependent transcriptional regulator [Paraflavitalea pollutisoli]|uniref:sigma-54-dependent transcriptional regulator n=1 Tax=Paraflavitalea pollutisoli TaxID=3034143 RepID=UPI0023ECE154|nr:sigma-54 dependent transcriptional regulator [Paraflavitalea sp. H1-2-19X]